MPKNQARLQLGFLYLTKPYTFESLSYANFPNLLRCPSLLIPCGENNSIFTLISVCSIKVMIEGEEETWGH